LKRFAWLGLALLVDEKKWGCSRKSGNQTTGTPHRSSPRHWREARQFVPGFFFLERSGLDSSDGHNEQSHPVPGSGMQKSGHVESVRRNDSDPARSGHPLRKTVQIHSRRAIGPKTERRSIEGEPPPVYTRDDFILRQGLPSDAIGACGGHHLDYLWHLSSGVCDDAR